MGWCGGPVVLLLNQLAMARILRLKGALSIHLLIFQELRLQFKIRMQVKLDILVVFQRRRRQFLDIYMQIHSQHTSVRIYKDVSHKGHRPPSQQLRCRSIPILISVSV